MKKYKIIANPTAGRGKGEKSILRIQSILQSYGFDVDISRTERSYHAAELAEQAVKAGYDVVVAAGGDGTVNEVLNGLAKAKEAGVGEAVLGVICVGRGNDFAFSMGIPVGVEEGCQTLKEDFQSVIDIGKVTGGLFPGGRYFGNGVGIGFDAVVGFVALKMKHLHGFLSYIVAALKTIFLYFKAPVIRVEYDGEVITQPFLMVSIMNGRRMGGGFMMAPDSVADDGLLDLCIASQVSRIGIFGLIIRFMKGTQQGHKAIITDRTRRIICTAVEGVLPAHADGETLCTQGDQLTVELLPKMIKIVRQSTEK